MDKSIALAGIFAVVAIIAIVLFVNSTITGGIIGADDFYVRPTGMQMRLESGVVVLQSDPAIIQVCRNAIACDGKASYTCCKHDGTVCVLPSAEDVARGGCPKAHRSRCQCKEDYVAGLIEKYG